MKTYIKSRIACKAAIEQMDRITGPLWRENPNPLAQLLLEAEAEILQAQEECDHNWVRPQINNQTYYCTKCDKFQKHPEWKNLNK